MSTIASTTGYTQAQPIPYTPPVRQPDSDTQRFTAQTQERANKPAVTVTLSPEAQKALAGQTTQGTQTA